MKPLNKGSIKRRPKCPVFHVLSLTRNFQSHRALYVGNAHFFLLALAPYTNLSYCQNINIVLDCIMHVIFYSICTWCKRILYITSYSTFLLPPGGQGRGFALQHKVRSWSCQPNENAWHASVYSSESDLHYSNIPLICSSKGMKVMLGMVWWQKLHGQILSWDKLPWQGTSDPSPASDLGWE